MKVEWDKVGQDNPIKSITEEITRLPELTEKAEKKVFKQIGDVIVGKVKELLPVTDYDGKANYDGSRPYVHMKDDVKVSVRSRKGVASAVIHGGKKTAYKWHLLDDGTRDSRGRVHTVATHFTSQAMKNAESEVNALIDLIISEVASGR